MKSIGEENGWCKHCKYAALCLPKGPKAFAHSFAPDITVYGLDGNNQEHMDALHSIFERVEGLVCELGRTQARHPMLRAVIATPIALTIGELRAFIRGYAKGVSETVCGILRAETVD